jgi:phosphotriesterase-related protein
MINTVTGLISPENIRETLIHEHFNIGLPGYLGDTTIGKREEKEILEAGVKAARQILDCGVKTVVDPTPNDYGRNVRLLREISEQTGLQIICATGYHSEELGSPQYFRTRMQSGRNIVEEIYDMMTYEISQGIDGTTIRAGIIKVSSSKGTITDYEKAFFKAAAKAQRETGVPIFTHTQDGTMGPEQADLLIAEGASPTRIVIGHMCCSTDLTYHLKTLQKGVFIGFDRFGFPGTNDAWRIEGLLQLIQQGYIQQLSISHDAVIISEGRRSERTLKQLKQVMNSHPTHIHNKILPILKNRGLSNDQTKTLLMTNPYRLFE